MKNESNIDLLKKVGKTEAPPWLFTRIQAKLRQGEAEQAPGWWPWATGLALAALLVLNLAVWQGAGSPSAAESLVSSLQLHASNQLYDE
ncbi:MAG: hypothetical protein IT260_16030 [Saprospiraceae bacterium]|nr:hypothetical protein [Saprospiraceae bacterium]